MVPSLKELVVRVQVKCRYNNEERWVKNTVCESWKKSGLRQSEKSQQGDRDLCSAQRDGWARNACIHKLSVHTNYKDQFDQKKKGGGNEAQVPLLTYVAFKKSFILLNSLFHHNTYASSSKWQPQHLCVLPSSPNSLIRPKAAPYKVYLTHGMNQFLILSSSLEQNYFQ